MLWLAKLKHQPQERYAMKAVQHSKVFFGLAGLTKAKTPVRGDGYHGSSYQLSLLSPAYCFRLHTHSHKMGCFTCQMTLVLH